MGRYVPLRMQLERSRNKSETCRWFLIRLVKRKKVLFPDEAERLWKCFKKYDTGRWYFYPDLYVCYGDGAYSVRCWSTRWFTKKALADRSLMMREVVKLEMKFKILGRDGAWV